MNDENLKHGNPATQFKTGRKQVETAKKGGRASGVAKRRNKAMKQAAQFLLNMNTDKEDWKQAMAENGIVDDEMTNQMMLLTSMLNAAVEGNVSAAIFMRDTAGYGHASEALKAEMKQRKAELEYKKEKDTKMEKGINRSTEDDPITKALKGEFDVAD